MDNITTMIHVNASVETHQCAPIHTSMIHTHASVFASLMHVPLISTLTTIHVAAAVMNIQPAQAISTSMSHHVNATVVILRNAAQENTMTMIHVIASARIHQLVMLHTIMTQIRVNVSVDHMTVQHISTLMLKPVAAAVVRLQPARGTNSSMKHPANANARGSITAAQEDITTMIHVSASVATLQHATHHSNMIQTCVGVSANPMPAIQVSTSIMRVAVVSVLNTRPAQTISTSIGHLANACVVR